jgi:hypothetical protein
MMERVDTRIVQLLLDEIKSGDIMPPRVKLMAPKMSMEFLQQK